ncbi:MAG: hypothetical protein HRT44_05295, partial [Bdellovibrionales bacterium]|nr:hypothetical protein [Bdellovibrionales bacterium]NQZ18657.1 hypothetical protein [Bdellovibrionales bacterium]
MTQRRNGRNASLNLFKALSLFSLPLVLTCVLTNQVSQDAEPTYQGESLQIQFTKFSPAYAAFEDEFLFEEDVENPSLNAGESDQFFVSQTIKPKIVEKSVEKEAIQKEEVEFETFSGLAALANPIVKKQSIQPVPNEVLKQNTKDIEDDGEFTPEFKLNFGPMIASLPKNQNKVFGAQKIVKKTKASSPDKIFDQKALKPKYYNVTGPIELKEGLAFVGSMEVSWVIDDQEVRVGAINTPDGTYDISVNDLIGDIIVSLYDENDELMGEGIANLDQIENPEQLESLKINIRPIDWDMAGEVIHVHSLNSHHRPISGAEVLLYAYNDAIETNEAGEIRFADWKKSNSRTLALASKEGYRDSVFLIDSKKTSKVLLFEDKYIDAFFSWIEDLGVYGVDEMGTIYGSVVSGNKSQAGYEISIGKVKPLYFNSAY